MKTQVQVREAIVRAISADMIEKRQAEFVISSEAVDTYDTVFLASGWDLERYKRNPVVLYAHKSCDDDPDMVIGTSEVRVEGTELIAVVTFESADINPTAEKIFQKVQSGTLRMASIAANIKEYRRGVFENGENPEVIYFTNQELLEWSIVPVGSNPDALKRSSKQLQEIKLGFKNQENTATYSIREAKYKCNLRKLNL